MNLKTYIDTENRAGPCRAGSGQGAVALVITLLMLSVITFLAIAFLAMTKRDRSAVTATLDVDTARSMSDAALARAQAEIIAQMMATNDILFYDYTASHNFINPAGFNASEGTNDPSNVNYDYFTGSPPNQPFLMRKFQQQWAQNIANLFYDPRPPVFVMTNGDLTQPATDFRYWVDINRNGRFESNGLVQMLDNTAPNGSPIPNAINFYNGEPEWIGVLRDPKTNHSSTNTFVGRYAFMVLPIGKTLDWNFIHNYSKDPGSLKLKNLAVPPDYFVRDQGVGPWELNLAAFLNDISATMYQTNTGDGFYNYNLTGSGPPFNGQNSGNCFDDAVQFIRFRYAGNNYSPNYPQILSVSLGYPLATNLINIDEYANNPSLNGVFDYTGNPLTNSFPWPGSYNTNMFYDVQDLFDTNKTGTFAPRLSSTMANINSYDRYTFQRVLASIGTGSAPEYGTYVYSNFYILTNITTPNAVPAPSLLRTKVNINYDNTAQIQAGPYNSTAAGPYGSYTPMPTNLVRWTNALGFFTNAADLLLRSQVFVYTNYISVTNTTNRSVAYVPAGSPSNCLLQTFGITNIPVYNATNPGIVYNEQVHRMLQMAANIYAAANPVYSNGMQQPPVFRPQFLIKTSGANAATSSNLFVTITNFVLVQSEAPSQINLGFFDLTNSSSTLPPLSPAPLPANGPNFWGIPWIIGAVKGIPQFDKYNYQSQIFFQRQLAFVRKANASNLPDTNSPPGWTNQFYEFSITNICGMDAWNPYTNNYLPASGALTVVAYNLITVTLTNNYLWGTNIYVTITNSVSFPYWPGWANPSSTSASNMFKKFLQTNFVSLPVGYFSESTGRFVPFPNPALIGTTNAGFLASDTNQTTYPTHYWTAMVTNHLYYALFDGNPSSSGHANLLDFVNLGPFGSSFPMSRYVLTNAGTYPSFQPYWTITNATDPGTTSLSQGALLEITNYLSDVTFHNSLLGSNGPSYSAGTFGLPAASQQGTPLGPFASYSDTNLWFASDPLVHYTTGDLYYPGNTSQIQTLTSLNSNLSLCIGTVSTRYRTGTGNSNIVFGDPGMASANVWQFPTNLFPGVGWLGRVHRGTPWQTIYLKADNPTSQYQPWYTTWVNSPYTYPTNDWSLVDLFTAAPNDNAARGLLSVNQTNDAAWAAVFSGVIALSSPTEGTVIDPTTNGLYNFGVYNLMEAANGINAVRTNQPNGVFHKMGDILQAPVLTTQSPIVTNYAGTLTDEMVERIPQQTLSLLKLGLPQFVIYSWGQSLRPKTLYPASGSLNNICTNYEITGEFLSRTVCHVVSADGTTSAPRIVIDNYNIEPGN